ncbi:MAG: endoglucanase [Candidatus Goldiibacteriota bacterium HGW-Goldbacteria-1]|jgi:endoglucanase|nr:MAG: endoglucanase [Candidatus Goldiibacteriota bacterium HGW-Goldbacteria-1]
MRKFYLTLTALLCCSVFLSAADSDIVYCGAGYKPVMSKKASVNVPCTSFQVLRSSDNASVYSGTASAPVYTSDSERNVYVLDFSPLTTPGNYYINVDGVGRTQGFEISETVFEDVFKKVFLGMYMWRSGTAVSYTYGSTTYSWNAGHMANANLYYSNEPYSNSYKDGTGGWYDAGDYGRYLGNVGITVWPMFMAWEDFGDSINAMTYGIPDLNPGMPEYLQEIKWETDWLFKMMYADGSGKIHDKLTSKNHTSMNVLPANDTSLMYFLPWSTYATSNFAGTMAMAARYFAPYDSFYAQECLDAAELAFQALIDNPSIVTFDAYGLGFYTGIYNGDDAGNRIWAAAELFASTGKTVYRDYFEARASSGYMQSIYDWNNLLDMAMLTYYFCDRPGKNSVITDRIRTNTINTANGIVSSVNSHGYGRSMSNHWWGSNGVVARMSVILYSAFKMTGDYKYRNAGFEILSHLFGRNHFGRSQVTGIGTNPALYPHDRRCNADGIAAPIPGYLVGGSHGSNNTDDPIIGAMPAGLPKAAYWVDNVGSYSSNEIAINWQAGLIYGVAAFLKDGPAPTVTPTVTVTLTRTNTPIVSPTPTRTLTATKTATRTITFTSTASPTPTITLTSTVTPFVTSTPTFTITMTSTITITATPTSEIPSVYITVGEHFPYPNPSKGNEIKIRYQIIKGLAKTVNIHFYTLADRKFDTIKENNIGIGWHEVLWKPKKKLASGMYYYVIEADNGKFGGLNKKAIKQGAVVVIK